MSWGEPIEFETRIVGLGQGGKAVIEVCQVCARVEAWNQIEMERIVRSGQHRIKREVRDWTRRRREGEHHVTVQTELLDGHADRHELDATFDAKDSV